MADLGPVVQDEFAGRHIPVVPVALAASPAPYQAPARGYLALVAGTVSAITLTRNGVVSTLSPAAVVIPMSAGDIVTVTYSVIPTTVNFIPN